MDELRMIRMIILMGRMLRMIILIVRMIILGPGARPGLIILTLK